VRLEGGLSESALDERVRLRIARTPPARPRAAWAPERLSARWRYITVHHSATLGGNARRFDRYHRTERHLENGLPYHFVIGNGNGSADGFVEVGPRWTDQLDGGHVRGGELNRVAIGICLVGNFETHLPSERQIASLKALLNFLLETTGVEEADVLGHRGMPGQTTLCPGRFLPAELVVETRTSPPGPAEGAGAQ
jgi:N-acetyl-anhydromuramyl-L-alanine amidase AmpD